MGETNELQTQMQHESMIEKEILEKTQINQMREDESKRNKEMLTK